MEDIDLDIDNILSETFIQVDLTESRCHFCKKDKHNGSPILIPFCRCPGCPYVREEVHAVCLSKYKGMTQRQCPGNCDCQKRTEEKVLDGPLLNHIFKRHSWCSKQEQGLDVLASPRLPRPHGTEYNVAKDNFTCGHLRRRSDISSLSLTHRRSATYSDGMSPDRMASKGTGSRPCSQYHSSSSTLSPPTTALKFRSGILKRNMFTKIVGSNPSSPVSSQSSIARRYASLPVELTTFLSAQSLSELPVSELELLKERVQEMLQAKSARLVELLEQQERLKMEVETVMATTEQLCEYLVVGLKPLTTSRTPGVFIGGVAVGSPS